MPLESIGTLPPFVGDSVRVHSAIDAVGDGVGGFGSTMVPGMSSVADVFGAGSRLVGSTAAVEYDAAGSPTLFFSVALVVCFVAWCLMLWAYRDYVLVAFNVLRGGVVGEKLLDKHNKVLNHYLDWAIVLGGFGLGMAVSQCIGIPGWMTVAGLCIAAGAVWSLQWSILAVAGRLTLYNDFTTRLFYMRKMFAATMCMTLLPVFLLLSLSGSSAMLWGLVFLGAIFVFFILLRTLMLFMREKLSILLWILYLCGIELLPVATLVIAAEKLYG